MIADGVYVHQGQQGLMTPMTGGDIANIGFIIGQDAVAVIDTGGSLKIGEALRRTIEATTDRPIRYVINTHMHPDHIFGNAAFLDGKPRVVGHARLNAAVAQRFEHYLDANGRTLGATALAGVKLVPADVEVTDEMTIDLGGRILRLKAWPVAHTDNDLTILDETTGTLFSGDLIFLEHAPSIDGSLRGWQRAIDELAMMPIRHLVPGHGPLDARWPDALEPERRYFETLARDIKAALDAGTPLSAAAKTIGRSEASNWLLFDEFNTRNATAAFAELEWE